MGWTETTARQRIAREALAVIEERRDGVLPWRARWSPVFADAADLRLELERRWRRQLEAQLGPELDEIALQRTERGLQRNHEEWVAVQRAGRVEGHVDVA